MYAMFRFPGGKVPSFVLATDMFGEPTYEVGSIHGVAIRRAVDSTCTVLGARWENDEPPAQNGSVDQKGDELPRGLSWIPSLWSRGQEVYACLPTARKSWLGHDFLEGFRTYFGAEWARVRLPFPLDEGGEEGEEVLVFHGRRGQIDQHNCGWSLPFKEAIGVVIFTTTPENPPELIRGIPVRAIGLPKPEGWRAPANS